MKPATLGFLALGTAFGFVLSRSGAADYDMVQGMFLFERFQLYGILVTTIALTAPGLWWLRRHGRSADGQPLAVAAKPRHRGTVLGGLLFGCGWAITGMCPGPIFVNLGEGKLYAIGALAGALVGAALFSVLYERLTPVLGLPAVEGAEPPAPRGATHEPAMPSLPPGR
jgi:uncharacterized membrane protein YedE/YeeE